MGAELRHRYDLLAMNLLWIKSNLRLCIYWKIYGGIFIQWHRVKRICLIAFKESGHIRRRFGRNVGIWEDWKIVDDSYAFLECYSLNSILEYRKIGKRSIAMLLCIKKKLLSLGLVSTNLKFVMDAFFNKKKV